MSYSDELAERIRAYLIGKNVTEKKMFGSLCFMVNGKMCVCAGKHEMLIRLSQDECIKAIQRDDVRPMTMQGRTSRNYVQINVKLLRSTHDFRQWMDRALAFNSMLHD